MPVYQWLMAILAGISIVMVIFIVFTLNEKRRFASGKELFTDKVIACLERIRDKTAPEYDGEYDPGYDPDDNGREELPERAKPIVLYLGAQPEENKRMGKQGRSRMADIILGGIVAFGLFIYLCYTLLKSEEL
jgi:K+-transporting ATPase KdpF subunit